MSVPPVRYADSDGAAIAYQVIGGGRHDLVVVPGFVWHCEVLWEEPRFRRFFERLASFARVILWDKREQGLSDRTGETVTLEQGMDDLRAVLDAANSPRATVLGVSEGGPMSLLFAATHPDRCARLILWGTYVRLLEAPDFPVGISPQVLDAFVEQVAREWGGPAGISYFAPGAAGEPELRDWWARFLRQGSSPGGARRLLSMYAGIDVRDILPSVTAPTLVLHRKGDRIAPVDQARTIAASIPGARLVEFEGADHLAPIGDQDAVLDEIEEFLTGTRSSRAPERVLATVLFTDVVDSTRLASEVGDRRWRELLSAHDERLEAAVARHRGRVVKSTGDGALALFDGPARAIAGARAARDELARIGLPIRAGLHTGEVELIGDDVGGIAVHIGARVAATAGEGEVRVSRTVTDLVAGSGLAFEDRGEHDLRGVPGSWRLYAVAER